MYKTILFVLVLLVNLCCAEDDFLYGRFPADFAWSCATSSYQIEGAWNTDGKGLSIWDTYTHRNDTIDDNSNGDIACDSYKNYKEDVQLLKNLGVTNYRFSISWPRVLSDGTVKSTNRLGIDYYNSLIDELIAHNITPQITLYHWDLPQAIEDQGGWLNESTADRFQEYAEFCYKTFGDRVKFWITFNEPWVVCVRGFVGGMAPGKTDNPGTEPYICGHTLLKAHAKAWHAYNSTYRSTQNGTIGITLNVRYAEPYTNSSADIEAADRAMQFDLGWFAHPIFTFEGNYPQVMIDRVVNRSAQQNLSESRLPKFTASEISFIKGTSDFFGLNFYNGGFVTDNPDKDKPWNSTRKPSIHDDKGTSGAPGKPEWTPSRYNWLYSTPEFMRSILVWIKDHYKNPPLYITENGCSDNNGTLADPWRVDFYRGYLNNVLKAITLDSCNVKGYTAWSLMDNFEWALGYTKKYGLHYVNFSDPARPRTPKDSARFYTQVIANHGFPEPPSPTTNPLTAPTPTTTKPPTTTSSTVNVIGSMFVTMSAAVLAVIM